MVSTDTFMHRGQNWTRHRARPVCRYIMGLDLGQSMDPTAIAIVEYQCTPLDTWSTSIKGALRQDSITRFDVRHLERMPLNTSYPEIVEHVRELLSRQPLHDNCDLVIDRTGVGRPVSDLFERGGLSPICVTITSSEQAETREPRTQNYNVGKTMLVSTLDARLAMGELRFAKALSESEALRSELLDFRRHVSAAGRSSYSARASAHDDLVLAVSLATWWAARPEPYWGVSTVQGLF